MLNWKFVAYALATIIVAAVAKDAVATDLRLKPTNGLCFITGTTAEEVAVLNFLERAVDGDKVYYSDVFMPCEAMDQIKSGERAYFYPIFVLMAQKTNGKLLPFTSMTIQKLKAQTEVMLSTHDFTKEIEKQADTLNEMAKESYQTTTFGMTMNEQAIIDVTENTLSVAQKSILVIDGSEKEMTSVITSVIVDGYVAYIQGTDSVSTAKDFWRLQSLTEWTARQIEVAK